MKINRTCKICGDEFKAIKVTQFFCSRKCFKKSYYIKHKNKEKDNNNNPAFPLKTCDYCQEESRLEFDPLKSPLSFNKWECPHCGTPNRLIWEHQSKANSYQIITSALIEIRANSTTVNIQQNVEYKRYRLPSHSLEKEDTSLLIMACDLKDITDLQKKDRKKILFS